MRLIEQMSNLVFPSNAILWTNIKYVVRAFPTILYDARSEKEDLPYIHHWQE